MDWFVETSVNTLASPQREKRLIHPLKKQTANRNKFSLLDEFSSPHWQFVSKKPTAVRDGPVTLKGSHSMSDGRIFIKILAPHSLMTIYRISLVHLAERIHNTDRVS
jgi:hypothetical protein